MGDVSNYDYELPEELIAQRPLAVRSDARLLVVDRQADTIEHYHVRDLPELLAPPDALIVNDSRVVAARLIGFRTQTGGKWEGLFLSADPQGRWRLLGKTGGRIRPGEMVTLVDRAGREHGRLVLVSQEQGGVWTAVPEMHGEAAAILDEVGRVPLPCYIRDGEMLPEDVTRYQTVYAERPGSAAAPTAGLHLTRELLAKLESAGVAVGRVTLHVGLDTFRPISGENLAEHTMHSEEYEIGQHTADLVRRTRAAGGRVVAVGTTSVRVLETAAAGGDVAAGGGATRLFIRPPYTFRAVDALITNFHLPRSTLLVLVRTFGGDALIMRAYEEAIAERYRFYSYGDAMLIR